MTADQMKLRLETAFNGARVAVFDLTGTQDHYQVVIDSNQLNGLRRIQQHQAVMKVFDEELKSGEIHALTISTKFED
ncbi:MAG: BolA/IbaG family iron-sulfur metabolism protein [Bdellovibrionales bacterium]|nr:BolA/IbaG family iron-sulfur metabolism protein [Bdellovibrionales bacterium]